MIQMQIVPKKLSLAKERIAELSNVESRLTASGNIDIKCSNIPTQSGDGNTLNVEVFI
jgi:hypothetical protein